MNGTQTFSPPTFFRWEAERGKFRPSDTFAFARPHAAERGDAVQVAAH